MKSRFSTRFLVFWGVVFALQAEVKAASNLVINPNIHVQNNLVTAVINVFADVEPGARCRLDLVVDFGRDGAVNGDDYALISFLMTEGERLEVGNLGYPNVPGDLDGAANGHLQAFVVIGMENQYIVPFVVRLDDGNGAAHATLDALVPASGYDVSGKVYRDSDPNLATPALVVVEYIHELIRFRSVVATDEAGLFSTTVPWGGDYMVYPQCPGMAASAFQGGGAIITRETGSPTPEVELSLTSTGLREIRGRVEGPEGEGIPFQSVWGAAFDPTGTVSYPLAVSMAIASETGEYVVPVVDGIWSLAAPWLHQRGYVEDAEGIGIENIVVSGSDMPSRDIIAKHPIESLVTGRLLRGDIDPSDFLRGAFGMVHQEAAGGEEWWYDMKGTNDQEGRFILGAFGGEWVFEVREFNLPAGANLAPPLPQNVTVTEGEVLDLGDIYLYPGYDRVEHLMLNGREHRDEAGDDIGPKEILRTLEEWRWLGNRRVTRSDFLGLVRGE